MVSELIRRQDTQQQDRWHFRTRTNHVSSTAMRRSLRRSALTVDFDSGGYPPKHFNPDPLLGAFASGLACGRLLPFVVKMILEKEGFFEKGKMKIEEFSSLLSQALPAMAARLGEMKLPAPTLLNRPSNEVLWQGLQDLIGTPTSQRVLWTMALQGEGHTYASIDPRIARELTNLTAFERLRRLDYPSINVPSLDYARDCLIKSIKKPAHRPPSDKNEKRFKTGAVAAALFRATGAGPRDARKWVAESLNRAGVWRPKGGSFKPKTIENWSTKGMCSEDLLNGMHALRNAPCFARRSGKQVAEVALFTAIHFSKLTKNS